MSKGALIGISAGTARLAGLVVISLLMLGAAFAQEADPPGRVARLSFLQGAVSLQPAGQEDWVTAELNRPLTTNDRIWSDAQGSRAELDLGGAVVRLGADTGFAFMNLDDSTAQMQVNSGTVVVHVRELLQNQTYEVDTPNVALLLEQPGQYRIDVNETGDTTVVRVSDGQAEASGGGQDVPIANQEMVSFFGTDQLSVVPAALGAPDGFDDWSFERDREMDESASRQYVAQDMVGSEDLDENGQWQSTPDYGNVWVPTTVAVGWAPYAFGHWAWVSPWGWTWVDSAPWGFAPFHYGRWARWHDSWCWVPGPRNVRPVYAPALVAWAGGTAGVGVAWFPLAPREVYVPGYRVSDRYVRTVNVTNTNIVDYTYINNVYQNRISGIRYANSAVPGAVTSVSRSVFTNAQPVNVHRTVLSGSQVTQLAPIARAPSIVPLRQSVLGGSFPGLVRRPPQSVLSHSVVARTAPPSMAAGVRVRLVGPSVTQQGRAFSQEVASQQMSRMPGISRPAAGAAAQARPPMQQSVPAQQAAEVDNRSWAQRARALEQHSLPSAPPSRTYQPPPVYREGNSGGGAVREYNEENYHPGGVTPQELSSIYNRSSSEEQREERSPQPEQVRAPANTYIRPAPMENRGQEERRFTPPAQMRGQEERRFTSPVTNYQRPQEVHYAAPPPAPVPEAHYAAPPPAPVPEVHYPAPPPAPVPQAPHPTLSPPQQHGPSGNEERMPPRGRSPRGEPR